MWRNTERNSSTYVENCLVANGYDSWTPHACHKHWACRSCIRDKVITAVNVTELDSVLKRTNRAALMWLGRHGRFQRTRGL